ncbi:MAG: phage tail assembly protein [Rhodopseudomonas palustris]|nr:MAG: phage tail assembly protein [Rhodopseudomonas palustris]
MTETAADFAPVTVQLLKPIKNGDQTITSLTFAEPCAGDMCGADLVSGDFQKGLAVFSGMCGVPLPVLKTLSARDIKRITAETKHLLGE